MHEKLQEVAAHGQSIWIDYIDRKLLDSGGLADLIAQGVTGVTTNPAIFHQAITSGKDYDSSIRHWLTVKPGISTESLLEQLMIEDVRSAADQLHEVWLQTAGDDGYVSIEVSPLLAADTQATVGAARRLHAAVARPNVMIKIPATRAGLLAIEATLAAGINVNVTLLFALNRYQQVLEAHSSALERLDDPSRVASVASFFVSRIDTRADAALEEIGSEPARALCGRTAIACAKRAWQVFRAHHDDIGFSAQRRRGARVQRLLFGSTGTKNPAYSDVLYVDSLIGRDTVNTLPPATLEAFLDHGQVAATLAEAPQRAAHTLEALKSLGVSLHKITDALEQEGVAAFADAHRKLLAALDSKRAELAA